MNGSYISERERYIRETHDTFPLNPNIYAPPLSNTVIYERGPESQSAVSKNSVVWGGGRGRGQDIAVSPASQSERLFAVSKNILGRD
jgi:hypothetical protein